MKGPPAGDVGLHGVLLAVENVSLAFGGVQALNDVSFDIRKGEIRAIIGPNGAGKTSMLNVINGFYQPNSGRLVFKGEPHAAMRPYEAAQGGIARTFQNLALFRGMTVLDNIMTGRNLRMKRNILWQAMRHGPALDEEIEHRRACEEIIDFLGERWPEPDELPQEAAVHLQRAAGHDVVERGHALEQGDVLKGARDPLRRRFVGLHSRARFAAPADRALLGLVEAVDDVEHRRLAGAVRTYDGADLPLADVERHIRNRLDPAEGQRHVVDRKQNIARACHATFALVRGIWVGRSTMRAVASSAPLRPSS